MLEILKYCIPALIVLVCVWIVMHKMFKNEAQRREWELKKLSQKEISPARLRAYERLSLLLERTQPEHLLMEDQLMKDGLQSMTIPQLRQYLLRTIRIEFDHNMSQQIYVSDEVWDKIMQARDQMGAYINAMAIQLPPESTSMDYAKVLLSAYHTNGDTPHQMALEALKAEARGLF